MKNFFKAMTKKSTIATALLLGVLCSSQMTGVAYASEVSGVASSVEVTTGGTSTDSTSSSSSSGFTFSEENSGANILESSGLIDSNVTADVLGQKLEEKGQDVISMMKTIGKYFCIGGFIVSCISMFCGLFGNKKVLFGGFIGIILSGVMYAAIVMSDEIVILIASWAAS